MGETEITYRNKRIRRIILQNAAVLLFVIFCFASAPCYSQSEKTVVVTTSLLEHAVLEVIPSSAHVVVIRLIPPGSCPGHFDLNPGMVPVLRRAVVVVRHNFQGNLEENIARMGADDVVMVPVSVSGSLLVPSSYAILTGQMADVLSRVFPEHRTELRHAADRTSIRMSGLAVSLLLQAGAWKNTPVIASINQKEFCEWLGFRVVGVINRPEDMSPRDFEKLIATNAKLVIGNLQEGAEAALSLGRRKGIPVAILSSFPDVEGYGTGFDRLANENIKRIGDAWLSR